MQVRKMISEVIPIVSVFGHFIIGLGLSASILPPANLLWVVILFFALLVPLLWSRFVKLHSRLQIALMETLDDEEHSS
jgi:CPA2 family monovalent cation:H+ antiporter-2